MGRTGRAERQVCDGASSPSSYQVRSVWPVRAVALHRSRSTNRTQDTVVTPWPGSDRAGAAPSQVFTDLAVVARRERLDLLVTGAGADDPGEVAGAVAGAVVGDDAVDVGDAVRGEPDLRAGQERGGGGALLVGERLGVGESGVTRRRWSAGRCSRRFAPAALARSTARYWSESRPWMRQPPPSGIRPTFFTSRCTMCPGQRAVILPGLRLLSPQGSRNRRCPRPSRVKWRVTVRRLMW